MGINAIDRVIQAVCCCPNCSACPYEQISIRYCGNCAEERNKDAQEARELLNAIRKTEHD
jgi:hypothetical protein